MAVDRAARLEFLGETARTANGTGQRRFVDEEHVVDKVNGGGVETRGLTCVAGRGSETGFPARSRDEIHHVCLMIEHHQRRDVATVRRKALDVETFVERF